MKKRDLGQFFTKEQYWLTNNVKNFILSKKVSTFLDPFAGEGDLLNVAKSITKNKNIIGLDIDSSFGWIQNDSLKEIPFYKNAMVITNPPYFAKVSAVTKKRESVLKYFQDNSFEDLYQIAIKNVLDKFDSAVFIIPETFINKIVQKEYINFIQVLTDNPFFDTDVPVCVVAFDKKFTGKKLIYFKDKEIDLDSIDNFRKQILVTDNINIEVKFNKPNPNIGIIGVDAANAKEKIKFMKIDEFAKRYDIKKIKNSSRAFYTASVSANISEKDIIKINSNLNNIRSKYNDVVLSPFKSFDKKGIKRRRLDFKLARYLISSNVGV